MRWTNGLSYNEKVNRRENWRDWFAWYPVIIDVDKNGRKVKAWWEVVLRKGYYNAYPGDCYWTWEYKAKWKT